MTTTELINNWYNSVITAIANALYGFLSVIPNILGALVVFVIGWIIAGVLKNAVIKLFDIIQLEPFAEKVGISSALKKVGAKMGPNELIGELVKWGTVLVFLSPAVEILGLTQVTTLINEVLTYIPNVLVAVLIVFFGFIFADLTAQFVRGTAAALGSGTASALSVVTKYAIGIFAVLAALNQMGIAQGLIATLFTGFVAMFAIAGGLAFGLGGKDTAAEILDNLKRSLQEKHGA